MLRVMRSQSTLSLVFDLQLIERLNTRQVTIGSRVIFIQPHDDGLDMGTGVAILLKLCFHINNVPYSAASILCSDLCSFVLEECLHVSKPEHSVSARAQFLICVQMSLAGLNSEW